MLVMSSSLACLGPRQKSPAILFNIHNIQEGDIRIMSKWPETSVRHVHENWTDSAQDARSSSIRNVSFIFHDKIPAAFPCEALISVILFCGLSRLEVKGKLLWA